MSVTLSLTEITALSRLRAVLRSFLSSGIEVVRGEINRVPEPPGDDFVVITPTLRERLGMNISTWRDGWFDHPQTPGTRTEMQPTRLTVQIDIHGPNGADNVQIISTLCRSTAMCEAFETIGTDVQILYASDPRQAPFINAEQQIEFNWSLDAVLQANPVVTLPQDFAAALHLDLHDIL